MLGYFHEETVQAPVSQESQGTIFKPLKVCSRLTRLILAFCICYVALMPPSNLNASPKSEHPRTYVHTQHMHVCMSVRPIILWDRSLLIHAWICMDTHGPEKTTLGEVNPLLSSFCGIGLSSSRPTPRAQRSQLAVVLDLTTTLEFGCNLLCLVRIAPRK